MKRLFVHIFCLVAVFCAAPFSVWADGMMIGARSNNAWDEFMGSENTGERVAQLIPENKQLAFIDWDVSTKKEKMMIVVDRDFSNDGDEQGSLYWIVPIKSSPGQVTPHHYDHIPTSIKASPINDEAQERRGTLKKLILGLQIWPLLGKLVDVPQKGIYMGNSAQGVKGLAAGLNEVRVYEKIESNGVSTEILSADNILPLKNYLAAEGISLTSDYQRLLSEYVDAGYCFAVSKVTNPQEKSTLGLMLEFETDEPFYPLLISSVYGSRVIKMEVFIDGVFDAFLNTKQISKKNVSYLYLRDDLSYGAQQDSFFNQGEILTKVETETPALFFTGDLFFRPASQKMLYINLILYSWVGMFLFFIFFSFVLARLIFGKRWLRAGLTNIFGGVFGLLLGLIFYDLFRVRKFSFQGILHHSRESKLDIVRFLSWLNKVLIFLVLALFFIFLISTFGNYSASRIFRDVARIVGDESIFLLFLIFGLPISFLISIGAVAMERIVAAHDVPLATRRLLSSLLLSAVNLFQFILFLVSAILFFACGFSGWLIGAVSVAIFFWFIFYHHRAPEMGRFVLSRMIYVFFLAGLFDIFAAILSVVLLYPYLICYYYAKNMGDVSRYFEERDANIKCLRGYDDMQRKRFDHSELVAAGIALYSIVIVIVYSLVDMLMNVAL